MPWDIDLRFPDCLAGIPERIDNVIILVRQDRCDLVRQRVHLERIVFQFHFGMDTSRVNHDVEHFQELNAVLDAPLALGGLHNLGIPVPLHVADRLGPRIVRPYRPPVRIRNRIKQIRRLVDLAFDHVRLVINIKYVPVQPRADQNGWIFGESPVSAKPIDAVCRRFELLDAPVLEHPRLAVLLVIAPPNMEVLIHVPAPVVFELCPEHLRKPGVIFPIGFHHHSARGRVFPQKLVHGIALGIRIPGKP